MKAYELLNNPFLNKGTAFSEEERKEFGLVGLLPPKVQSIDEQAAQVYSQYQTRKNNIERRHFLMELFNVNRTLFYYVFKQHVAEFMPIVYDPTIADSIENYSEYYITSQYAAYLSIDRPEAIEETLKNAAQGRDIELIVVTDAEGILGIGDWGVNGVGISVGKLMVYTAAAGIDPSKVLPVVIDAGTNRKSLLGDPLYLGNRHERIKDASYYAFVDSFVQTAERLFPNLYLHWEDFGRDNAAKILDLYKDKIPTFNDDIQGTGIITLAGILGGLSISGESLKDQTYVCFGAGTAGCGIVKRVYDEMIVQGMSEEEAKSKFYLVDKQGLLFDDMTDLTPEQQVFARKRSEFTNAESLTTLTAVVKMVNPTILVGTSTVPNTFTREIVQHMAETTAHPMIFPLSNPTALAEATAKDIITWSDGKAFIGTGIPSEPILYKGVTYKIGQANNALIYPGLGLGVIATRASKLTDEMISAAAHALGAFLNVTEPGAAIIPPVEELAKFSETIAIEVAKVAIKQGLNRKPIDDVEEAVKAVKWHPVYKSIK